MEGLGAREDFEVDREDFEVDREDHRHHRRWEAADGEEDRRCTGAVAAAGRDASCRWC